jgi:cytochrome P450
MNKLKLYITVKEFPQSPFATITYAMSTAVYIPREAAKDVKVCGAVIPKGTVIMIVPAVSHFNPRIWGVTAEEFDPDRWDNLPEAAANPFTQQSFLSGPRVCIGKAFALLEYKAILIDLVRNFEFQAGSEKVELTKGAITLRPSGGLKVRIIRRQDVLAVKQEGINI